MSERGIPVLLTVKGRQSCAGESDETELTTEGLLEETAEGWRLTYRETELTGLAGSTTCFTIAPGRVTLRRSGAVQSLMIFEEGERRAFRYATAYGSFAMETETERIRWHMSARGGLVELRYRLRAEGQIDLDSRACLQVREKH